MSCRSLWIPLSLKFPCPLTVTKRAVRLASLPGPLDFARAAISASATKPTGNRQAPDHFYPCLSIPCVIIGLSICVCIPWHTCLSVVNWEKCPVSSLKNVWLESGQSTRGPRVLFFPEPRFLHWCSTQQPPNVAATGYFKGMSTSKCWNSSNLYSNEMKHTVYSPYDQQPDHETCISYLIFKDRQRTPVTSSTARLNQPHLLTQLVASFLRMLNLLQMFICHEEIKTNRICTNENTQQVYILIHFRSRFCCWQYRAQLTSLNIIYSLYT